MIAIEIAQGTVDSLAYLTIWTYTVLCLYQVTSLLACIFCLVCGGGNPRAPSERSTLVKTHANENNAVEAVRNLGYLEESVNNSHSSNGKVSTISRDADGNYNVDNRSTASATDLSDPRMNRTCWYMKVTWCLADVVYTFGIIVTLVYFTALFPYIGVTSGFIHDLNVHAFNTLQILIDIAIVARPVRLLHALYPLLYGIIYVIFSIIYWSQDKVNNVLYPNILDWNKPGTTILFMILLTLIGLPVLQLILFGLYRLRLHVYKRLYETNYLD